MSLKSFIHPIIIILILGIALLLQGFCVALLVHTIITLIKSARRIYLIMSYNALRCNFVGFILTIDRYLD